MPTKRVVEVLLTLLLLAGCSTPAPAVQLGITPTAQPAATITQETPGATPTKQPTLTRTALPTPARTPRPSLTPTPSPDGIYALGWNQLLGQAVIIENLQGVWSPTANEIVALQAEHQEAGSIILASAPDFTPRPVPVENASFVDTAFAWSLDGSSILFGGPFRHETPWVVDGYSVLWTMDRSGANLRQVLADDDIAQWLTFLGWMDERTMAMSGYEGGGNWGVWIVDVASGEIIARSSVRGPAYAPNANYIPASFDILDQYIAFVITRQQQPQTSEPRFWTFEEARFVRLFPLASFPPQTNVQYEHWLPGTNDMLVHAFRYDEEEEQVIASQLLMWDVDRNWYAPLVGGGAEGRFSPDGKTLALISLGPVAMDKDRRLSDGNETIQPDSQPYLQVMGLYNRQVSLQLPALAPRWDDAYYMDPNARRLMEFSPNSRYLAFLTPGEVRAGADGWLTEDPQPEDEAAYLNVFDLEQQRLVLSVHTMVDRETDARNFAWSPQSRWLVYPDPAGQWFLLDPATAAVMPLTLSGDEALGDPQWTFDEGYLSFTYTTRSLDLGFARHMVIVQMPAAR